MRGEKARLLDELRRSHNRDSGSLEPSQRVERSRALLDLAGSLNRPVGARSTDEPPELLLAMLAHFRRCARQRRE